MTPSIQRRLALNIGFGMAVTAAGVAAFLSIFTADAYPHDAKSGWAYPIACCAGFDCGEIPASTVQERPDAIGLAVPGMPYGSPGMGSEDGRDAYDVLLVRRDGSLEIFTSYQAA